MDTATILVAYGHNYEMGLNGKLPNWKLPADMAHFKEVTMDNGKGSVLIMGRKTFESFPQKFRPLPDRLNYILSRQESYIPIPQTSKVSVYDSIYKAHGSYDYDGLWGIKVFFIGGAEIYKEALVIERDKQFFVNEIIATEVAGEFEADTFFPALDYSQWQKEIIRRVPKDERNSHDFTIVRYTR